MKSLLFVLLAVGTLLAADVASAQRLVVNPPGLFNRTVVRADGPNAALAASVNGRGNVSAAASFGNGAAQAQAQAGRFNNKFAAASFNGFSASASVGNNVRFNSFGTRTIQDRNGNVFEQDQLGNVRFLGNRFNSANFVGNGFNTFNNHSFGFNSFGPGFGSQSFSFGVRSGGGFCH